MIIEHIINFYNNRVHERIESLQYEHKTLVKHTLASMILRDLFTRLFFLFLLISILALITCVYLNSNIYGYIIPALTFTLTLYFAITKLKFTVLAGLGFTELREKDEKNSNTMFIKAHILYLKKSQRNL